MSATDSLPNVHTITSPAHFQELLSTDLSRVSLLNFWAPWAEPCTQMNEEVTKHAKEHPNLLVLNIEAEEQADIAESFEIASVPTFIVLRGHTLLARIEGADTTKLTSEITNYTRTTPKALSYTDKSPAAPPPAEKQETKEERDERLRGLMTQERVMLFMKGSPDVPRCGFSRQTVALLRERGVEFGYFDILTDETVRSGLKELNNWPTFPQLIVDGEFVGGLDILREMVKNDEFDEVVKAE